MMRAARSAKLAPQNWPWMDNLRAQGVEPEEIDIVMCAICIPIMLGEHAENGRWVPTFPNANYLFHKTEYEYWEEEHKTQDWARTFLIASCPWSMPERRRGDRRSRDDAGSGSNIRPVIRPVRFAYMLNLGEHGSFAAT